MEKKRKINSFNHVVLFTGDTRLTTRSEKNFKTFPSLCKYFGNGMLKLFWHYTTNPFKDIIKFLNATSPISRMDNTIYYNLIYVLIYLYSKNANKDLYALLSN